MLNLNFFFLYQFSEFFKSCIHNCRSIINSKSWYGADEILNVIDVIIQWKFSYQHTHTRNLVGFFPPGRAPRLLFLIPITYTSTPSFVSKSGCGSRRHTSNARVQRWFDFFWGKFDMNDFTWFPWCLMPDESRRHTYKEYSCNIVASGEVKYDAIQCCILTCFTSVTM